MSVIYANELVLKGTPPLSVKATDLLSMTTELQLTTDEYFDATDNNVPRAVVFEPIAPTSLNRFSEWDGRLRLKAGIHKFTFNMTWRLPIQELGKYALGFSSDTGVSIHNRTVKDTSSADYRMVGINESTHPSLFFQEFIPPIASDDWDSQVRVITSQGTAIIGRWLPSAVDTHDYVMSYTAIITLPDDDYIDFELAVGGLTVTDPVKRASLFKDRCQSLSIQSYSLP